MPAPSRPVDELERLSALRALALLDTPVEPTLDRITRLLASSLQVPVALISLLDERRQWFKSRVGLDVSETPRDLAFCGYAILGQGALVVPDAQTDARFSDNALVTGDPHIRFYAGVPVRTLSGHPIGTLCAIDRQPRHLSEDELSILQELADMVSRELQLREVTQALRRLLEDTALSPSTQAPAAASAEQLRELLQRLGARLDEDTQAVLDLNQKQAATIAQLTRSEKAMHRRTAELQLVLDQASYGYIGMDSQGLVTAWNLEAQRMFGWSADQAIGRPLHELIVPPELQAGHCQGLQRFLEIGRSDMVDRDLELPARHRDGHQLTVEMRIRHLLIDGDHTFSAFLHDITERKAREEQRMRQAQSDPLTGMANRRVLEEQLPLALQREQAQQRPLALLFIDLDGFKAVNDTFGHQAGDEVLRQVATRLRGCVRETDLLVRYAGDEFVLLLEGLHGQREVAEAVAAKVLRVLEQDFPLDGDKVAQLGASIGIALHLPGDRRTAQDLIAEADRWMYEAKRAGKGRFHTAPLPD